MHSQENSGLCANPTCPRHTGDKKRERWSSFRVHGSLNRPSHEDPPQRVGFYLGHEGLLGLYGTYKASTSWPITVTDLGVLSMNLCCQHVFLACDFPSSWPGCFCSHRMEITSSRMPGNDPLKAQLFASRFRLGSF